MHSDEITTGVNPANSEELKFYCCCHVSVHFNLTIDHNLKADTLPFYSHPTEDWTQKERRIDLVFSDVQVASL